MRYFYISFYFIKQVRRESIISSSDFLKNRNFDRFLIEFVILKDIDLPDKAVFLLLIIIGLVLVILFCSIV